MTDDAVGLEALRAFAERYAVPEGVDLLDGGTLGLDLLVHMEGYPRILVADCVTAGHAPGTLLRVEGEDVPRVFSQCLSPHQMGLKDLVAVMELQGRMPDRMIVLGVEPQSVELGLELSAPVDRTLPRLVEAMAGVLREWRLEPCPRTEP
ncbi:MAG: HyaD/HybD family hydrogenase maturation endopeptidase [Proteobacteria bacterium]|nr:HyaD/HybD family hydrogenase maturation endopeptidase [Pseudomonadota bacterium]